MEPFITTHIIKNIKRFKDTNNSLSALALETRTYPVTSPLIFSEASEGRKVQTKDSDK